MALALNGHAGQVQYFNETLGKLQAALTRISEVPHAPGMDPLRWQEQLQVIRDKLEQAGVSPSPERGKLDCQPSGTKEAAEGP